MPLPQEGSISTWPPQPVDVTLTGRRWPVEAVDGDGAGAGGYLVPVSGARSSEFELPDEFVLHELLELDLGDHNAANGELMADIASTYGIAVSPFWQLGESMRAVSFDDGQTWEVEEETTLHIGQMYSEFHAPRVQEVFQALQSAQALAKHWIARSRDFRRKVTNAWPAWYLEDWEQSVPTFIAKNIDDAAWVLFDTHLNAGLLPYTLRVNASSAGVTASEHRRGADLYSLCCLQLWNLIAGKVPIRKCRNEACRRPFVKQEGRAQHGQNRVQGEIKYCSLRCSNQQRQRVWRKNQRDAKGKGQRS